MTRRSLRGFKLRELAEKKAADYGVDLQESLWRILRALMVAAEGGDITAAKLVFEWLCESTQQIEVNTNFARLTDEQAAQELETIFAAARKRQQRLQVVVNDAQRAN